MLTYQDRAVLAWQYKAHRKEANRWPDYEVIIINDNGFVVVEGVRPSELVWHGETCRGCGVELPDRALDFPQARLCDDCIVAWAAAACEVTPAAIAMAWQALPVSTNKVGAARAAINKHFAIARGRRPRRGFWGFPPRRNR